MKFKLIEDDLNKKITYLEDGFVFDFFNGLLISIFFLLSTVYLGDILSNFENIYNYSHLINFHLQCMPIVTLFLYMFYSIKKNRSSSFKIDLRVFLVLPLQLIALLNHYPTPGHIYSIPLLSKYFQYDFSYNQVFFFYIFLWLFSLLLFLLAIKYQLFLLKNKKQIKKRISDVKKNIKNIYTDESSVQYIINNIQNYPFIYNEIKELEMSDQFDNINNQIKNTNEVKDKRIEIKNV